MLCLGVSCAWCMTCCTIPSHAHHFIIMTKRAITKMGKKQNWSLRKGINKHTTNLLCLPEVGIYIHPSIIPLQLLLGVHTRLQPKGVDAAEGWLSVMSKRHRHWHPALVCRYGRRIWRNYGLSSPPRFLKNKKNNNDADPVNKTWVRGTARLVC